MAEQTLTDAVRQTLDALKLGPADAGTAALALSLAAGIDAMDEETRGRMLGQTSGALLRVLTELRSRGVRPEAELAAGPAQSVRDELRARRRARERAAQA